MTPEQLEDLEQRHADYLNGKEQTISQKEMPARLRKILDRTDEDAQRMEQNAGNGNTKQGS